MCPEALGLGRVSVGGSETALEGGIDSVGLSRPQAYLCLVGRVAEATVFNFPGTWTLSWRTLGIGCVHVSSKRSMSELFAHSLVSRSSNK